MAEVASNLKGMALRGLETAAASQLQKGKSPKELVSKLFGLKVYKQERLSAGINLVGYVVPGFEEFLARTFTRNDKFPFQGVKPEMFFRSGENSIFLIEGPGGEGAPEDIKVLKINRESLGLTSEGLLRIAKRISGEYKKIRFWYRDIPGFVPKEDTLIVQSHFLSHPAAATVQEFIPGEKKGVFEDFSEEELATKLEQDTYLRQNFISFAKTTLEIYDADNEAIDLVGARNVVITEDGGKPQLVLLDPHVIYSPERLSTLSPSVTERLKARIGSLRSILSRLEEKPIPIEQTLLEQEVKEAA